MRHSGDSHWAENPSIFILLVFVVIVFVMSAFVGILLRQKKVMKQNHSLIELVDSLELNNAQFKYDSEYKTIVLDTVFFMRDSTTNSYSIRIEPCFVSNTSLIKTTSLSGLMMAGKSLQDSIKAHYLQFTDEPLLLIIEGQTRKTDNKNVYSTSYLRAMELCKLWQEQGISFNDLGCEVIITGTGQNGKNRFLPDDKENTFNDRVIIHIRVVK